MYVLELTPKTPCDGLLPINVADLTLSEVRVGHITSLAPRMGQRKAASSALKKAHNMTFPAPGRATGKAGCRAIWSGQGQAFLLGPAPDKSLTDTCALTDQSDGWAVMELGGPTAREVLARLSPLDLRPSVFKRGATALSLLGHMNAQVTRTGADTYQLMVFRSMAATAVHELGEVIKSVEAQR